MHKAKPKENAIRTRGGFLLRPAAAGLGICMVIGICAATRAAPPPAEAAKNEGVFAAADADIRAYLPASLIPRGNRAAVVSAPRDAAASEPPAPEPPLEEIEPQPAPEETEPQPAPEEIEPQPTPEEIEPPTEIAEQPAPDETGAESLPTESESELAPVESGEEPPSPVETAPEAEPVPAEVAEQSAPVEIAESGGGFSPLAVPLSPDLQAHLAAACAENGVPLALAYALIDCESNFRADCVSATHDYGLFQVNRCNLPDCRAYIGGDIDILDPATNITCGVWLFAREFQAAGGDITAALMRYNCGPTGARRKWARGIYETAYTRKITQKMAYYQSIGA